MGTRIAVYLAKFLKNRTIGLVLVDGSKFCDRNNYSEIIINLKTLLKKINMRMFYLKCFQK